MNNTSKVSIVFNALFAIILAFLIFDCNSSKNSYLKELQIKQKQIDDITRSSSSNLTKEEVKQLLKENKIDLSKIENDLKSLGGKVEALNQVQVVSVYQNRTNVPTENVVAKPQEKVEVKPEELKQETQYISIGEQFANQNLPFGKVGFSFWRKDPWEYEVYKRNYRITNVISKDKDNNTIVYNKFTVNVKDKDYDILIDKADSYQILPENKFHLYPKIFLSVGSGYSFNKSLTTAVYLYGNFIQYGKYRNNPTFSILNMGIGTNFEGYKISIVPVFVNLQSISKLLQNSYLGIGIGMDFNRTADLTLNFGLSF
jgi:hypothetical protein